jgi:DNA-binding NarL/FixJ family response regulator
MSAPFTERRASAEERPQISATASWREVATAMSDRSDICQPLSPAERVVLEYIRRGLTNREIAAALGKAEATVKNQVAACLHKCGVPTRGRLMALERAGRAS